MARMEELLRELTRSVAAATLGRPATSDDSSMNLLRDFLRGKDQDGYSSPVYARPSGPYSPYARVVLSGGGYELLFRVLEKDVATYLLNMDHPLAFLPVADWREKALSAADDVGVELLPLSERAYQRVAVEDRAPRLVHREGFEAVFTVTDAEVVKYYLSGYDQQESPPLYFLCRLPHAVHTMDEAREALKPESVRIALAGGAAVRRQGDLFFIATNLEDSDVRMATNNIVIGGDDAFRKSLYGTAHYADSIAHLPGAVMLAKGTVHHWPRLVGQRRDPDHSDLILADGWWMVARNTVPAERPSENPDRVSTFVGPEWLQSPIESMAGMMGMPAEMIAPRFQWDTSTILRGG